MLPLPVRAEDPNTVVLVVSRSWTGFDAIPVATLRNLWLGRLSRFAGRRVECLDLPAGSRVRRAFLRHVLGRSERAVDDYWIEQALLGGPLPPRQMTDARAVVEAVAARRGRIGYVTEGELAALPRASGVRTVALEIDGEVLSPDDPRYPIRADTQER